MTFDLNFDLLGTGLKMKAKLFSPYFDPINKMAWSEIKCVGGPKGTYAWLRLYVFIINLPFKSLNLF